MKEARMYLSITPHLPPQRVDCQGNSPPLIYILPSSTKKEVPNKTNGIVFIGDGVDPILYCHGTPQRRRRWTEEKEGE